MKNENLVHLKFDYEEAIQSKKDILYVEKTLMVTATKMKAYLSSRFEELEKRLNLHKKSRELVLSIKKIQKNIPNVEFSGITKEKENEKPKVKKREYDISIKSQLQEIQNKLDALQR